MFILNNQVYKLKITSVESLFTHYSLFDRILNILSESKRRVLVLNKFLNFV